MDTVYATVWKTDDHHTRVMLYLFIGVMASVGTYIHTPDLVLSVRYRWSGEVRFGGF